MADKLQIPITSAKGVVLKTEGKFCDADILVTPELEELTVTENGEYAPDKAGYSKVTVNVAASGGGEPTIDDLLNKKVVHVNLPTARYIPRYAFYNHTSLESVSMPKAYKIEINAFYQCTKLSLTELPSGLADIDKSAFSYCNNISIAEIPSSVTGIYMEAFRGCTGITSLTFKGTPNTIFTDAFRDCTNLTTINVPWAEGAVSGAPWGATNATINYNYTGG